MLRLLVKLAEDELFPPRGAIIIRCLILHVAYDYHNLKPLLLSRINTTRKCNVKRNNTNICYNQQLTLI